MNLYKKMSNNLEEKENLFLSEIINQRKQSANFIKEKYKNHYESKMNLHKFYILNQILLKRESAIDRIKSMLKGYLLRKKTIDYIQKIKTSYIITTAIEGYDNLKMKVYFGKHFKIFDVIHEPFLNKQAIYIPRNKITKNEYQVNFISNDKIVIDPSYFTSQENGIFVNIINFERIKKEELSKAAENEREKKYILMYLRSQGIKFTEKGVEFEYDDDLKSTATNSPQFDIRKRGRFGSFSMNHRSFKKFGSIKVNNLPKPKSILKLNATENIDPGFRKRRMSGMLNIKKVSFGNVEFGY